MTVWCYHCSHCPEEQAKPWLEGPLGKKPRWRSLLNCIRTREFLGLQALQNRIWGSAKAIPETGQFPGYSSQLGSTGTV